jgi:hypothetical protein
MGVDPNVERCGFSMLTRRGCLRSRKHRRPSRRDKSDLIRPRQRHRYSMATNVS